MTVDVSLLTKGRIEAGEVAAILGDLSGRPTEISGVFADKATDTDYFKVDFRNPFNRRHARTLRAHHSAGAEERYAEHVGSGEYTYMVLGSHDDGERIMRALAERFGGCLENDEGDTFEYVEPASWPRP